MADSIDYVSIDDVAIAFDKILSNILTYKKGNIQLGNIPLYFSFISRDCSEIWTYRFPLNVRLIIPDNESSVRMIDVIKNKVMEHCNLPETNLNVILIVDNNQSAFLIQFDTEAMLRTLQLIIYDNLLETRQQ